MAKKNPPLRSGKLGDQIKASIIQKGSELKRYAKDLLEGERSTSSRTSKSWSMMTITKHARRKIMLHSNTFFEKCNFPISQHSFNLVPINDIAGEEAINEEIIGYEDICNGFTATQVFFNPNFSEVKDFYNRLTSAPEASQTFTQISSNISTKTKSDLLLAFLIIITLNEISKLSKESEIVTKVTIQKLETTNGWYYDGCPCDKKAIYEGAKLMSKSCHKEVLMTEFKVILSPTVEVVEKINDCMYALFPGDAVEYFSSDSMSSADRDCASFQELYTTKFLNTIKFFGLPPHRLALKVGVPIMLVRNIYQAAGICNGLG
ncbi:hypothetical protein K1719_018639 [Acacia pycnantha]|nr:hypothetical protein K1719_018639 [Acacia pycnantha]